ncbi:50S ribosomal protein L11 methyltransferase [Alteribacillus iranensis]|uniref:Ribosomal protein L11 methyltransferase n=1 Tax=Alteribacillus iranensis TaxID=930128 RepID=A0A1I1ZE20_9BACI|nr:50S ribosomal protein L11 methyltransferase [Alteribacillus iranensis]SFE28763.1 [LSU ribosomal protein L11P]-lysine N-methyltransferase [Alteribacillus iranensis]
MDWIEFSIHTTQEATEPISNILHEAGASGVAIVDSSDLEKDWEVTADQIFALSPQDYPEDGVVINAYFPIESFGEKAAENITKKISDLRLYHINLGRNYVTLKEVHEEDWADSWKKYYKPVQVTKTLTISPSWEDYQPKPGEKVIELDPGMAFGTGTHPTTVLCLTMLEERIHGGEAVIDVGTGSGILSIASAKFGAEQILALDVDDKAVQVAEENIDLNNESNRIHVRKNNLLDYTEEKADIIVANILAEIILDMINEAYQVLHSNGIFITSGIISRKREEVETALLQAGFEIVEVKEMDDWVSIAAKK